MPDVQLPIDVGLVTDGDSDWLDSLPTNMVAVPKPVLEAEGYMHNWPGLIQTRTVPGVARGGVYNVVRNEVYRVQSTSLVDGNGNVLADVGGFGLAQMPFSVNSQAIVSNGMLRFFRPDEPEEADRLTNLQNWVMGERGQQLRNFWNPVFADDAYIRFPAFMPTGGFGLTAMVTLTNNQTRQWIIGSLATRTTATPPVTVSSGLYVENGMFRFDRTGGTDVIGPAIVGDNTISYNTTQTLPFALEFFGGTFINNAFEEGSQLLDGRISEVRLSDRADPGNSRGYTLQIINDSDTAPTADYILDDVSTPTNVVFESRIELVGGAPGSQSESDDIVAANTLELNDYYLLRATVQTQGTTESGFSPVNGINNTGTINGAGEIFSVFRATSITNPIRLFTRNSATTFRGVRVQRVEHGLLFGFPTPAWSVQVRKNTTSDMPPTDFDLANIVDATRNRGRYIWISQGSGQFGVTDLENERRPDYLAPFYSAEAEPDNILAIDAWKGFVVAFSRFTIEYFSLTGNPQRIYTPSQSLTVRAGVLGRGCKCHYLDSFAILGGPQFESPSIYLISQGSYREIATRRIQKLLRSYTIEELERGVYMEPVKFDAHDFLVVHLPNDVLVYDFNASGEGRHRWSILKSDVDGNVPYRGIYHVHDGDHWTVGDKIAAVLTQFSYTDSRHVGEEVEFIVDTPMIQARNKRLFDLQVDAVPGRVNAARRLAYSVTLDGLTYGQEHWINFDRPQNYTERILSRQLGYVKNNVGFRLRWVTPTSSTVSNFRVRVE